MNAKNPKFAIAPKGKYHAVESGVKYPILKFDGNSFEIKHPSADMILFCLVSGCSHLDGKNWILRNK